MQQMTEISRMFKQLSVSFGRLAEQTGLPVKVGVSIVPNEKKLRGGPWLYKRITKRHTTPALKLHGKYLGATHNLSKANRARAKSIRQKKGVHAAIAWAKSVGK